MTPREYGALLAQEAPPLTDSQVSEAAQILAGGEMAAAA